MFPLFHIFLPLFLSEVHNIRQNKKNTKFSFQKLSLIIGSIGPDLIDKPFEIITNGDISGRGLGHSPFILLLIVLVIYSIEVFQKKSHPNIPKNIAISFLIGAMFHLLLDIPDVPWLSPFVSYNYGYTKEPLLVWLHSLLTKPEIIITELTGLFGLIYIAKSHNLLFNSIDIKQYLF